jgi:Fe-S oxidoreductase
MELGAEAVNSEAVQRILRRDSEALLFVEFMETNRVANARKLKELADCLAERGHVRAVVEVIGPAAQEGMRRVHRYGLQRLYGRTSLPAAFAPVADFALPLGQMAAASEAIAAVLARHGWDVLWHGHADVGALYMRPWLAAGDRAAREAQAVAADVSAALTSFAGGVVGVEGQGMARSFAAEAARSAKLTQLLEQIKTRFDPKHRLNPGKIVAPALPDARSLRSQPPNGAVPTLAALSCDGTSLCRRLDTGVMCPSFRLTRDERDSPRGRANTLRLTLAGELGPDALASEAMRETMALCASCKACRVECPRAVDIAQARIAVQQARLQKTGPSKFEASLAFLPHHAPGLRGWRHLLNLRDLLPWTARLSEKLTGVSADRPWPHWSAAPFSRHAFHDREGAGAEILLFPDTFNSHFDPVTLRAGADVLAASGFRLHLLAPPAGERPYCCGRTFLEMGYLDEARREAQRLIAAAKPFIERGIPLIGLEPACLLTMRDEFVSLLALDGAKQLAASALLFEEIMSRPGAAKTLTPLLLQIEAEVLFFAHCHQHAFGTAALARQIAALVPGTIMIEAEKACCGMGTTFGYRPETVSSSLGMGELSLFPQIRRAGRNTLLVADGFACRKQIADGTGRAARHSAVLLKLALAAKEKFGREWDDGKANSGNLARRLSRLRRDYFR